MSRFNIESFYRTLFVDGLPRTTFGGTYTVSRLPSLDKGFLTVEPNTDREEIIYFSGKDTVNKTITITHRAISPTASSLTTSGVDFAVSDLVFSHPPMCLASADINNLHINSGSLDSVTFANAAARDAAIPSPTDGMSVYLIAEGYFTDRVAGAWVTRAVGGGTVQSVSVASTNGFAGTVANTTSTPTITLTTTRSGMLKGAGGELVTASSGVDFVAPGAIASTGITSAANKLVGRTSTSSGTIQEISIGNGLELSGTTLQTGGTTPAIYKYGSVTQSVPHNVTTGLTLWDTTSFNNGSITSSTSTITLTAGTWMVGASLWVTPGSSTEAIGMQIVGSGTTVGTIASDNRTAGTGNTLSGASSFTLSGSGICYVPTTGTVSVNVSKTWGGNGTIQGDSFYAVKL